jgi:hypothetical protein
LIPIAIGGSANDNSRAVVDENGKSKRYQP